MQLKPDDRFDALCGHFGAGNPVGGIWIIGIEEGGDWCSAEKIDAFLTARGSAEYDWCENGYPEGAKWPISSAVSKICHQISGMGNDWRDYRKQRYQTKDGDFFVSNLYPLARRATSTTPQSYKEWFGYENELEYKDRIRKSDRFRRLREFWAASRPKITICHGKQDWPVFQEVLRLGTPMLELEQGKMLLYSNGIFLTPHLSRGSTMPDSLIRTLVTHARPLWND